MKQPGQQLGIFTAVLGFTVLISVVSACDSKKKDKSPARSSNATGTNTGAKPQVSGNGCPTPAAALQNPPAPPAPPAPGAGDDTGSGNWNGGSQGPTGNAEECAPASGGNSGNQGAAKPAPSPGTNPSTPGDPGANTGAWTPGKGIVGCEGEGKVWIAVNKANPGKSGSCGESLANFCCTQSGIMEKFPKYKSKLEPEFAKYTTDGLILYGCSTDGSSKTTFHFAKVDDNGTSYRSMWLGEKSEAGTPPDSCPRVELEDLGYVEPKTPPPTATGTSTSTSTGTTTQTGTSTGTATSTATATATGTGT